MSFRERSQSSRNGLPERRGYTWRGEANPAARAILRRLSPAERLDLCEAITGPDPEWHAELRQEEADAVAAMRATQRAALATSREARCSGCGYTTDYCCCPGGPRGGVAC